MADREDWRALPLVTIDPPDAKDHDDAVHAEPDPDPGNPGGFIVTVAIADVAWYVRPGSALDREAVRGEHRHQAACHVLAAMVSNAFHHRQRARIADRKTLPCAAGREQRSTGSPVKCDVAQDHMQLAFARFPS